MAAGQILRLIHKARRVLDVPDFMQYLEFQDLRRAYYAEFWQRAAMAANAECSPWHDGYFRIRRGRQVAIVKGGSLRLDDHLTLQIFGNKLLTYKLLEEQGCTLPRHMPFTRAALRDAGHFMEQTKGLAVVKPVSGTGGGAGVSTGIANYGALKRAAWQAAKFDTNLMIEQQIEGDSYRLLYLDGAMIDAVKRVPPKLKGDGVKSIAELVKAENRRRIEQRPYSALSPLKLDADAMNFLKAAGRTPKSRPMKGETITVKRAANENTSAENHRVYNVHGATADLGTKLARNLGIKLMGLDIIAKDISSPLTRDNGVIGEVNTTPGLHHHDLTAAPAPGNIAARIIKHMFSTKHGVMIVPDEEIAALPAPPTEKAAG
ncbi:MAG: cyanophycin synthetase [Rhizobiales bacterium]|nr:cyanophycin synthetase [Hyphomicrobiales bacterium]